MANERRPTSRARSVVRTGQGSTKLTRDVFARRLRERFYDPAFDAGESEMARIIDIAWDAYHEYRKSPRTRRAGPGFADPEYELPIKWLAAPSVLKLMMDRLVCADGGNPDLTSTHGKKPGEAKQLRNAARSLVAEVRMMRSRHAQPDDGLVAPRPK